MGADLEPIIIQLGRWSSRSPAIPVDAPIGADSVALSFKALFDARVSTDFDATVVVNVNDDSIVVRVVDGRIDVARDAPGDHDVVLATDRDTLAAVLWGDETMAEAIDASTLELTGNRIVAERFLTLFPMPEPAPTGRVEPAGSSGGASAKAAG